MRRRAFTLIELLVVVAILGVMVTVAAVSIQAGTAAARMKGSVRDVFATVRLARSIALVTQKPCVITFSTKKTDDGCLSHVEIVSTELIKPTSTTRARAVTGEWTTLGGDEDDGQSGRDDAAGTQADAAATDSGGGETVEEILFAPVSDEVFKDICIKVVMDDEELDDTSPGEVNEAKRSMISTFSNVDFLLGTYKEERRKRSEAEAASDENAATAPQTAAKDASSSPETGPSVEGETSLAWQVNGRCEPHTIYVYAYGEDFLTEGWQIRVDRFGAAKTLEPGEVER